MSSVRRPSWPFIISRVVRNLNIHPSSEVMNINVEIRRTRFQPGERDTFSIRRPRGFNGMSALLDQTAHICTILIHDVNLRAAVAVRRECDLMAGTWIP